MGRPAARVMDPVVHPLPPVLQPGPGSLNVLIGGMPAWRGVGGAAAAAIQSAKATSDAAIKVAEAATVAAAGTPGLPAAKAAEETAKATAAASMGSMISGAAGGADIHVCATPLPLPPHGPGVVVDGSPTVLINGLPACRQGDTIVEAVGPPNKIAIGLFTVLIGDAAGGGSPASNLADAIASIKASDFGKTAEGKKVVEKIEQLQKDGKIVFEPLGPDTRGQWSKGKISVSDSYAGDPDAIASELVHEATHAVHEDDFPASKTKLTIDEEMRTNENQLDYYEQQRKGGFRDPELEDRRNDRAAGKLRDNVRSRYPDSAEHL